MKKPLLIVFLLVLAGSAAYLYATRQSSPPDARKADAAAGGGKHAGPGGVGRPVSVQVAVVKRGEIDVTVDALGTVTAYNTAVVRARVDGQLLNVNFREGQMVKAGELLATIDPRPFQIALDQASGQLRRDEALLANARVDVERYRELLAKDSIARQQLDAQQALVSQYEGAVQSDRAQVDNAKLQLGFTRITAPLGGRLGLRQIDAGNMVHASDANGIVTITQTQPINVIFAIPADQLGAVQARLHTGAQLAVDVWDRDGHQRLAQGRLLTVDNQIDTTTGTVKLKAQYANADNMLFPNQFVNARLRVDTRKDATLLPVAAIQRGTQGSFVYVVGQDHTVSVRPVVLGTQSGEVVAVDKGVAADEQVVIDGADKLRQGAKVEIPAADAGGAKGVNGTNGTNGAPQGAGRTKEGKGGGRREGTAAAQP